jgi:TM2 domain-containing membrane protein YozV
MNSNDYMMMMSMAIEERHYIETLLREAPEEQKLKYLTQYNFHRKDPKLVLVCTLLGFGLLAGVQRFLIDDIIMGIAYFLTCGFCFVGTIYDAIRYEELAFRYNKKVAIMIGNYTLKDVNSFNPNL